MSLWLETRRQRERREAAERMEQLLVARRSMLKRIEDICADVDVRLDRRPGVTVSGVKERLGAGPSNAALQRTHARLLRWASLGCPADMEEEV